MKKQPGNTNSHTDQDRPVIDIEMDTTLPTFSEVGISGIAGLPRLWKKAQLNKQGLLDSDTQEMEWQQDMQLMDKLGIGLELWTQQIYQCADQQTFEEWVKNNANRTSSSQPATTTSNADSLSAEQLEHFERFGYLVIPAVIEPQQCRETLDAIWTFMNKQENDSESWYRKDENWKGIMVQFFQHPALEKNRQSKRIRSAFQTLWQQEQLVTSADRVSFNPPETSDWSFPGPHLHWDVRRFENPMPFGLQGLLYLTDTTEEQGAFNCVSGFHQQIDKWLESLPEGADPQAQDLQSLGPKPIAANAGDFIIWHHALPHGSAANHSDKPRIVQYINMYPASTR